MIAKASTVIGRNQPERNRYAFWVEGLPVPLRISVIAGEVLHHLRSALDHVVWELSLRTNDSPKPRIQFPISDSKEKFQEAIKRDLMDLPSEAILLIEMLQPYNADPIENSTLRILNAMDNADKHRLLAVVSTAMRPNVRLSIKALGPGFSIVAPDARSATSLFHQGIENGVEVQWISYDDPNRVGVEMQNDFTIEIAFDEIGSMTKQPVIPTLVNFCNAIESYVGHFESFFAEQEPSPKECGLGSQASA